MVYFAKIEVARWKAGHHLVRAAHFIKIGHTATSSGAKMSDLRCRYGMPVTLLATMPGDLKTEAEIHLRFDHLRMPEGRQGIRKGLEWFYPTDELRKFVENLSCGLDNV